MGGCEGGGFGDVLWWVGMWWCANLGAVTYQVGLVCWLASPLAEGRPDSLFFGYFREWLTDREEDTAYG